MKLNSILLLSLILFSFISCQKQAEEASMSPPEGESCVCAEIYAPVCGVDGVTYSNACHAGCKGVEFTEGECSTQE